MADTITLNPGAAGAVLATDDIAGVHYPIQKLAFGALDSATLAASGAGAVSAGVQRVTLASDDPGVALLGTIDADTSVLAGTVTAGVVAVSLSSVPSHAVTNAGTFAVQVDGAALTSLQLIDDVIVADDAAFTPATTKVAMAGFTFDDVAPDSVNEGDGGAARMSANRNIYVNIRDNAGNERGLNVDANGAIAVTDGAASLTIDNAALSVTGGGVEASALRVTIASDSTGVLSVDDNGGNLSIDDGGNSITVDNGGTFAVQATVAAAATNIAKAEDVASADADVGVPAMAVRKGTPTNTSGTDGDYEMLQMSAGRLWVDASGKTLTVDGSGVTQPVSLASVPSHAVTNAGTFAVQDSEKIADDAAFTVATTKVMPVGFLADETSPDSVNEGDVGAPRMTLDRMIRVVSEQSDTIRANGTSRSISKAAVAAASSGNNTLVTNSNGGLTIRVYALTIVATAAVSLYFTADAGGTVVFGGSTNKISLAANSGLVLPFNPAGWFDTSANTDVVMNLSGAVAVSGGIVYAEV